MPLKPGITRDNIVDKLTEILDRTSVKMRNRPLLAEERAGIRSAFSTRGKTKGYLKSKCPSPWDDPWAAAAWQGMQPNGYKLGIGIQWDLARKPAGRFLKFLQKHRMPDVLDRDKESLKAMGAW